MIEYPIEGSFFSITLDKSFSIDIPYGFIDCESFLHEKAIQHLEKHHNIGDFYVYKGLSCKITYCNIVSIKYSKNPKPRYYDVFYVASLGLKF